MWRKGVFSSSRLRESHVTHIRDVGMLPGERITNVFSPELGLTGEPPLTGRVLVTTNHRVLAFCRSDGRDQTFLVPVEEMQSVDVKASSRSSLSLLQGTLLTVGGIFLYVALAYWLTGRFGGPTIPVISMDIGPFLVLVLALLGVALLARRYFARKDGTVTFRGNNFTFAFPYRGDRAGQEVYHLVNSAFAARRSKNGYSFLWDD